MSPTGGGWRPWTLLAPAALLIGGWWVLPILSTAWSAIIDGRGDHVSWLVTDGGAREAVRNTAAWVVVTVAGSTGAGLGLAALAERFRMRRALVGVVMVPAVVSLVTVAVMWRLVLAFRPPGTGQVGLLNALLTVPGLDPRAWLTQAPLNTVLLAGALVWVQTAVALVVLSVAVAKVPESVRDAARVDGASEWQVFGRITVPSVRGAVILAGLASAAVAVRAFDLVKVATDGQHGTSVLATEMFDQAFLEGSSGRGAAVALLMGVAVLPLAAVATRRLRRAGRTG